MIQALVLPSALAGPSLLACDRVSTTQMALTLPDPFGSPVLSDLDGSSSPFVQFSEVQSFMGLYHSSGNRYGDSRILTNSLPTSTIYEERLTPLQFRPHGYSDYEGRRIGSEVYVNGRQSGIIIEDSFQFIGIFHPITGKITQYRRPHPYEDGNPLRGMDIRTANIKWRYVWDSMADIKEALASYSDPYALVQITFGPSKGRSSGTKFEQLVFGRLSIARVGDQFEVIKVLDRFGKEHLIDPHYFSCKIHITEGTRALDELFPPTAHAVPYNLSKHRSGIHRLGDEIARAKVLFDNEHLYSFFAENPDLTYHLLRRWYPDNIADELIASANLNPQFMPLLLDPGISNRLQHFCDFAKSYLKHNANSSAWELRRAFSDHLGTSTVYRGMMITDEELDNITKGNMLAHGFCHEPENLPLRLSVYLDPFIKDYSGRVDKPSYPTGPYDNFTNQLTGFFGNDLELRYSYLMSVSVYRDVAASVAYHEYMRTHGQGDRQLRIFKLELPNLSLLRQENLFPTPAPTDVVKSILTIGEGFQTDELTDKGVELLILNGLSQKNILEIEKYEGIPPEWERTIIT
jgi:hypothetical protein